MLNQKRLALAHNRQIFDAVYIEETLTRQSSRYLELPERDKIQP